MSCLSAALDLIVKRDWLREELRAKLLLKFEEEEIEQALTWLDKHHVIQDHKVILRSAELNAGRKAVSREAWMEKLRRKGAEEGLLEAVSLALPSDLELATQLLKSKSWKNIGQAARHLSAKGFESETIESALEASFDGEFRSQ